MSDWIGNNMHSLPKRGEVATQRAAWGVHSNVKRTLCFLRDLEKKVTADEVETIRKRQNELVKYYTEWTDIHYVRCEGRWIRASAFLPDF